MNIETFAALERNCWHIMPDRQSSMHFKIYFFVCRLLLDDGETIPTRKREEVVVMKRHGLRALLTRYPWGSNSNSNNKARILCIVLVVLMSPKIVRKKYFLKLRALLLIRKLLRVFAWAVQLFIASNAIKVPKYCRINFSVVVLTRHMVSHGSEFSINLFFSFLWCLCFIVGPANSENWKSRRPASEVSYLNVKLWDAW